MAGWVDEWVDGLIVSSYTCVTNVCISRCYPTPTPITIECTCITLVHKHSCQQQTLHLYESRQGSSVSMSQRGPGQIAAHGFQNSVKTGT